MKHSPKMFFEFAHLSRFVSSISQRKKEVRLTFCESFSSQHLAQKTVYLPVIFSWFFVQIFMAVQEFYFLLVQGTWFLFYFVFVSFFQERCINAGTLTVNYEKVDVDYRLKHNDLLANIVHR